MYECWIDSDSSYTSLFGTVVVQWGRFLNVDQLSFLHVAAGSLARGRYATVRSIVAVGGHAVAAAGLRPKSAPELLKPYLVPRICLFAPKLLERFAPE